MWARYSSRLNKFFYFALPEFLMYGKHFSSTLSHKQRCKPSWINDRLGGVALSKDSHWTLSTPNEFGSAHLQCSKFKLRLREISKRVRETHPESFSHRVKRFSANTNKACHQVISGISLLNSRDNSTVIQGLSYASVIEKARFIATFALHFLVWVMLRVSWFSLVYLHNPLRFDSQKQANPVRQ